MDIAFHYPPELLGLLIDTLPKLCKAKKDLLLFFQGAGVEKALLVSYEQLLRQRKEDFNKYHVARELLTKINEKGERTLRERRELLKRVVEFDSFSLCWPNDQSAARGLVSQIRELVNVKDSFTRMSQERDKELEERRRLARTKTEAKQKKKEELEAIRKDFFALFSMSDPYRRGKAVEAVLNRYFQFSGILISEAVAIKGDLGKGTVEQIDGVIELRGQLFLVEMKWEKETLGRDKVASHLVRVFSRSLAGGIIISNSRYSDAALNDCREALRSKIVLLCSLEEFVRTIEREIDLSAVLEAKIDAAVIHKNPFFIPNF